MTEAAVLTRHEIEARIVQKSWNDEAFRAELIADPAATFTKYLGVPADQLPSIVVHEEAVGQWNIVLPARPANPDTLSDEELERVAGGGPLISAALVISVATATLGTASVATGFATAKMHGGARW